MRATLRTLMLALAAFFLAFAGTHAEAAKVKSMSFSVEQGIWIIHVTSSDGKKWDTLSGSPINLTAHMKAKTPYPGYVRLAEVDLGKCSGGECAVAPLLWWSAPLARQFDDSDSITITPDQIPSGIADHGAVLPHNNDITKECNKHLTATGPTEQYSYTRSVDVTFGIETDTTVQYFTPPETDELDKHISVDHAKAASFDITVICDPVTNGMGMTSSGKPGGAPYKVTGVKLQLQKVTPLKTNGPRTCPKVNITVEAEANQIGPVDVKLWTSANGAITPTLLHKWTTFDAGRNGYFATFKRTDSFTDDTVIQYKAEVQGGTFAPQTAWKLLSIHCLDATGNTLSASPPPGGNHPTPDWTGTIKLSDTAPPTGAQCPRKARIRVHAENHSGGPFNYRISCTNGASLSGKIKSVHTSGGKWAATASNRFDVTRTRKIACTLQEMKAPGVPVTIASDSRNFTCAPHGVSLTAPAPVPVPGCAAGYQRVGGRCVRLPLAAPCPSGEILANGKCIKKPTVSILCKPGYILVKGKCIKRVVVTHPACKPGYIVVRGKCVLRPH